MSEALWFVIRLERLNGGAMSVTTESARAALDVALNMIADGGEVTITDSLGARYDLGALAAVASNADDIGTHLRATRRAVKTRRRAKSCSVPNRSKDASL